jgi:hypothetical protein
VGDADGAAVASVVVELSAGNRTGPALVMSGVGDGADGADGDGDGDSDSASCG